MEIEAPHQHHGHGTGTRWLDISLALCAFFVSIVSLYLGIHSAHTMEKLVASNSYPNIDNSSSTLDPALAKGTIHFELINTGVGPARIEWVSVAFRGKPVRDMTELLTSCCEVPSTPSKIFTSGDIEGTLLPAGRSPRIFTWPEPAKPEPAWNRLSSAMQYVAITTCYCSVFDECYIRRPDQARPQSTQQCIAPAVPFHSGFLKK